MVEIDEFTEGLKAKKKGGPPASMMTDTVAKLTQMGDGPSDSIRIKVCKW